MARTDLIVSRTGESITGEVLNKSFTIRSAFGKLTIQTKKINWIHFRNPPRIKMDEIWHQGGDRATGDIQGSSLRFRPRSGEELVIQYSTIHTVMIDAGIRSRGKSLAGG